MIRETLRNHRFAVLIAALYIVLATAYNFANPLFESPDERLHYQYVEVIRRERTLPIVDYDGPLTEYHQPPLYYVLTAILTPPVDVQSITAYREINPFWGYEIGRVGDDNKNQYLHGPEERFPPRGPALALHGVRMLSTVMGLATIVLIYVLACRLLPASLAAASMAVAAFAPTFLLTTTSISNDPLVAMFAAAAGLLIIDLLGRDNAPSLLQWLGMSVIFGLGVLAKTSFLPLVLLLALAVAVLAWRLRDSRLFVVGGLILLVGVGTIAGWWIARNLRLYGDLTGFSSMWAVWGVRPPLTLANYRIELHNFRTTFWANFGYGNIPLPNPVYRALDALGLGALVGLFVQFVRTRRQERTLSPGRWAQIAFLTAWVLITVGALSWYLQRTFSVTGRQLYAALPGLAVGLVAGWAALTGPLRQRVLSLAIGGLMLFLAVGALIGILIPAYAPSPRLPADAYLPNPLDWRYGDVAELVGYDVSPVVVEPGGEAVVTLYWRPLSTTETDYTVFLHLLGRDDVQVGGRDTYPGLGNDPTSLWEPGGIIVDSIPVPVAANAEGPILLNIEAGLYDLETGDRLPITDALSNPVDFPIIGTVKLADMGIAEAPNHQLVVRFEGEHTLAGYDLMHINDALSVMLYWQPVGPLPADYTIFVHLVDADGEIVVQADSPPLAGRYPTSRWDADEMIIDEHVLDVSELNLAVSYRLRVGLYDPVTGTRLPLVGGGDYVEIDVE